MKVVFMGSPEFAVPFLRSVASVHDVLAVVTQPDRPAGRGRQPQASSVKIAAQELVLPILQPESVKDPAFAASVASLCADVSVVVAFSLLPKCVLAATRLGALNVHGSLLPRYRGAAPVQWAVANGELHTGVTVFRLDEKMDHGPILRQESIAIGVDDTSADVLHNLVQPGLRCLMGALQDLESGAPLQEIGQNDGLACPARKLRKEDGCVDWNLSAVRIHDRIRGFSPWPGGYTFWGRRQVILHRTRPHDTGVPSVASGEWRVEGREKLFVGTNDGELEIVELQVEGRKRSTAPEFLRGMQDGGMRKFENHVPLM